MCDTSDALASATVEATAHDDRVSLVRGDCVAGMREHVDDDSVDLVLADPPYDVGVGGAAWDRFASAEAHLAFTDAWLREAHRVLRPGGGLLVWGSPNNLRLHRLALHAVDAVGFAFVQEAAWCYASGGDGRLGTMRSYATRHERCLWLEKPGGARTFRPAAVADAYTDGERDVARRKGTGRLREDSLAIGRPPRTWFQQARVNSRATERRFGAHPAMKPLSVCARLLRAHTAAGDLVVVPFGGSGSEALQSAFDGRRCVVFERDEAYCDIIARRLTAHGVGVAVAA